MNQNISPYVQQLSLIKSLQEKGGEKKCERWKIVVQQFKQSILK